MVDWRERKPKTRSRGKSLGTRREPKTNSIHPCFRVRDSLVQSVKFELSYSKFKETKSNDHCFFFKILNSLSHHGLKYLDISECSNITSKALATLLTQQPSIEQLSLQGTCQMPTILEVFEASRRFLTRLRYIIISRQCYWQIITNERQLFVCHDCTKDR